MQVARMHEGDFFSRDRGVWRKTYARPEDHPDPPCYRQETLDTCFCTHQEPSFLARSNCWRRSTQGRLFFSCLYVQGRLRWDQEGSGANSAPVPHRDRIEHNLVN